MSEDKQDSKSQEKKSKKTEIEKELKKLKKDFKELEKEKKDLEEKFDSLEKELEENKDVSKKAQSQYLSLKQDFDIYVKKAERDKENMETTFFVENLKNILPLVEELRKTIENIPEDIKDNDWVKWIKMVYQNFLKKLNQLWVCQIESIWEAPDPNYHEPIGVENTDEEDKKNKIIKEFEKWYIYKDSKKEEEKLIKPSKVIVWQ